MAQPKSVLFACNKNSIRSPIAAALVRQKLEGNVQADACGIEKDELNPFAFGVCEEVGLNLIPHFAKTFEDVDVSQYDLVIALSQEAAGMARAKIAELSNHRPELEFWFVEDPSREEGTRQQIMMAFRACRDDLEKRIKSRFFYALPKY
ncbi:MAG: low molecular weight phosphatase family protein [Alphaproteobacteria bacterium]|nr:MAG: low molecular weight phosphatase family protein [Alphaproteobacteria bacterium]